MVKQGVSMTHLHVLWMLEHHGELTMSRLADLLDVSLSNATGLIDRMEERGLVERDPRPDDRRVVLVRSPRGARRPRRGPVVKEDLIQTILAGSTHGQLERVRCALERLCADGRRPARQADHRHRRPLARARPPATAHATATEQPEGSASR